MYCTHGHVHTCVTCVIVKSFNVSDWADVVWGLQNLCSIGRKAYYEPYMDVANRVIYQLLAPSKC